MLKFWNTPVNPRVEPQRASSPEAELIRLYVKTCFRIKTIRQLKRLYGEKKNFGSLLSVQRLTLNRHEAQRLIKRVK